MSTHEFYTSITVLDTETTNLLADQAEIVELAERAELVELVELAEQV